MRVIRLIIAAITVVSVWSQTGTFNGSFLYVNQPLKWERPERPGQPAPRFAFANLLIIEPKGTFAAISCLLYKTPDKRLNIIYSEGYGISSGTWNKNNGTISVRSRSIYSNVRAPGSETQPYKQELWAYGPTRDRHGIADWIKIGNTKYIPLRDLADPSELMRLIQFHRHEADSQTPESNK
jgi:hypothetical protein